MVARKKDGVRPGPKPLPRRAEFQTWHQPPRETCRARADGSGLSVHGARGGALLHLLRGHVLDVGHDVPDMAEGIRQAARAVAVELIRDRPVTLAPAATARSTVLSTFST